MILVIKHIGIEGPGCIAEFFKSSSYELNTIELDNGGILPNDVSLVEAVILLGGPMNVYEERRYPFLKDEDIFLKKVLHKEIPVLGICLGAQLLAKAYGAKVRKAEQEEIGWYTVRLTEEGKCDVLFRDTKSTLDVFQWHSDVFEIPEGGTLLATSNVCTNQAFRCGKNAYGIQFHIEITPHMIESWINEYLNDYDQQSMMAAQKMLIQTYKNNKQFKQQAHEILLNFTRLIGLKAVNK